MCVVEQTIIIRGKYQFPLQIPFKIISAVKKWAYHIVIFIYIFDLVWCYDIYSEKDNKDMKQWLQSQHIDKAFEQRAYINGWEKASFQGQTCVCIFVITGLGKKSIHVIDSANRLNSSKKIGPCL